jgi:AcrR family transcriptional regulator
MLNILYVNRMISHSRRAVRSARTRSAILDAARALVGASADPPTVGAVARHAGVSRLSVYHHFGSHSGLLRALADEVRLPSLALAGDSSASQQLRQRIRTACERWASEPALFRRLPAATEPASPDDDHELALRLAAQDQLRPGCSLREAEDVIGLVTSFAAFDPLHQGGRRSVAATAEILSRMAGAILVPSS